MSELEYELKHGRGPHPGYALYDEVAVLTAKVNALLAAVPCRWYRGRTQALDGLRVGARRVRRHHA